jgi:hypothetical protein
MATLSQALLQRMRDRSKGIKDRQSAQFGPKAPRYDLFGKNAVVQPGGTLLFRLFPHWDYLTRWVKQDGKMVANPAYEEKEPFFVGREHWYEVDDGKGGTRPARDWCLSLFDDAAPCPLCDASDAMLSSADADEKKAGKDLAAKEVFGFNGDIKIQDSTGTHFKLDEKGRPDVRIMFLSDTITGQYLDLCSGGEAGEEHARGDVTSTVDGYTLKLTRPKGKGERWRLDAAINKSALYDKAKPEEAALWKEWWALLHDVADIVKQEMRTYDAVYKDFHGQAPEGADKPAEQAKAAAPKAARPAPAAQLPPDDEFGGQTAQPEVPETPGEVTGGSAPDGGFELPEVPDAPPTPKRAAAPRVAGRR